MKSRTWFYIIVFIVFSTSVHAQFELGKNKIKLNVTPKKEVPKKVTPKTNPVVDKSEQIIKYEPEFFKPKDPFNYVSSIPKIGEIQENNFSFRNSGTIYSKRIAELNKSLEPVYVSQNFGSYNCSTKYIKILCRDYDAIDGDMVRVLINEIPKVKSCVLVSEFQTFIIELPAQSNLIDFMALNEGEGPPNTAEFAIYDENDNLIYNSQWVLYEGYRARIIINKT